MSKHNENSAVVIKGRLYRYDPDFDAYYALEPDSQPKWPATVIFTVLMLAAIYFEFYPIR